MLTFASDAHRQHHPMQPFHDQGHMVVPPEVPERADRIRAAIEASGIGPVREPREWDRDAILRVHTPGYVDFLEHVHVQWRGATGAAEDAEAVPYARAIRGQDFAGPVHPITALGWYSHDGDAVLAGTWAAAGGAVDVTMSAFDPVASASTPAAYALARPPGHRAAADSFAGYCFLNNAAIATGAW